MTLDVIDDDQDRPPAVNAFTRSGYDGAGLREIARAAGVTAMMVNREVEELFRLLTGEIRPNR